MKPVERMQDLTPKPENMMRSATRILRIVLGLRELIPVLIGMFLLLMFGLVFLLGRLEVARVFVVVGAAAIVSFLILLQWSDMWQGKFGEIKLSEKEEKAVDVGVRVVLTLLFVGAFLLLAIPAVGGK